MDEPDIAGTGPQPATDTTGAPIVPQQREPDIESHFETPNWLGPDRSGNPVPATQVHSQVVPHASAPAGWTERSFIETGHWVESTPPRRIAGTLLTLALLGVAGTLVWVIATQSVIAIVALVICGIVAVIFRGALISSGVTTVDLKGTRLTVSRDGARDEFNLIDPVHPVEVLGDPGDPSWRIRLETVDGRVLELTAAHVDPHELHPAVVHYRVIADRERADRERRFNR